MSKNVRNGNMRNCEKTPINADMGFFNNLPKCSSLISRATPNITKAIAMFRAYRLFGLKFKRISSNACSESIVMRVVQ